MNENETVETVVVAAEKPGKKAKDKVKAKAKEKPEGKIKSKPARAKAEKPAKPSHDFDFVGKVDSLRVRSGAGPEGFEFGLRGRHGKRRHFRFDTTDAFAMNRWHPHRPRHRKPPQAGQVGSAHDVTGWALPDESRRLTRAVCYVTRQFACPAGRPLRRRTGRLVV